jgi:hypothetical protein
MAIIDDTVGKLARVYDSATDTWIPLVGSPVPHVHNLSTSPDVDITEPLADNEILQYSTSASAFVNAASPVFTNMSASTSTINTSTINTSNLNRNIFNSSKEIISVSATVATGTINVNSLTSSIYYYTSNASANWIFNIRGDSSTTLNSIMSTGETLSVAFLVTNGGTAYYPTSIQIDGTTSGVITEWQGGSAPTSGNINSIDTYTFTVIKTANATFTLLAAQTQFA